MHEASDSCICCLLSYGEEGKIWGKDSNPVNVHGISRMLVECKSLEGKPKIFFIQACQGNEAMKHDKVSCDGGKKKTVL